MELSVSGSLPPPRCGHTATMVEKRLLVYGGRGDIEIWVPFVSPIFFFGVQNLLHGVTCGIVSRFCILCHHMFWFFDFCTLLRFSNVDSFALILFSFSLCSKFFLTLQVNPVVHSLSPASYPFKFKYHHLFFSLPLSSHLELTGHHHSNSASIHIYLHMWYKQNNSRFSLLRAKKCVYCCHLHLRGGC